MKYVTIPSIFVHIIKSKKHDNGRVIVFVDYDYFLHRRDFMVLLKDYKYLVIVPPINDDSAEFDQNVNRILNNATDITVIKNTYTTHETSMTIEGLIQLSKPLYITNVEDFCEKKLKKIYISENINQTTLTAPFTPLSNSIRFLKRSMDILLSCGLLIASIPFWCLSAWIIKIQSPGSIFYRQKRVGLWGEEFEIIKFRSMDINAEKNGPQFSSKKDERVFPFGKLMRKTRIDELPQLINVLKGEVSLIGPRPERKVFTDSFEEVIPHYNDRHLVKPGISGYAQVMYNYGSGVNDARHKLMYDLYYIKNWSVKLETQILWDTIITIVSRKGL